MKTIDESTGNVIEELVEGRASDECGLENLPQMYRDAGVTCADDVIAETNLVSGIAISMYASLGELKHVAEEMDSEFGESLLEWHAKAESLMSELSEIVLGEADSIDGGDWE